jgi:hypothetical protein
VSTARQARFAGLPGETAPLALLGLALVAAAVLLLHFASGLSFFQDSWDFLINRRGFTADAFLQPHNEHIVVIPVAIEQLLLRSFGMASARPEFVVLTAFLLIAAALVFAYVRRRLGPWPALMAAVLLLFLGPAWQVLLWPFEIGVVGSLLCGIAMLLALERDDARGDAVACLLLTLAIGFSSLGLAFVVGAAVDVAQRRRARGLKRAYLAAVPLLLYLAWFAGWGHEAESHLSLHNALRSPPYLFEGFASSLDALLALATIGGEAVARSKWGPVALIALVAALALARRRLPALSPRLWPVASAAVAFWLLAALSYIPGREAHSSRYLYIGAAFLLLIVADLLSGARPGRGVLLVAGAITVAVAALNLTPVREGRDFLRAQTVLTRSDLAAIEIARRTVAPRFRLTPEVAGTPFLNEVEAGGYLAAVREYGSPAYTPTQLTRAPEAGREQADVVLAHALPVTIEDGVDPRPPTPGRRCVAATGARLLPLRPGLTRIGFPAREGGTIRLRRFATTRYPLLSKGTSGSWALLQIAPDQAGRRWRLRVDAAQGATVCR